MVQNFICYNIEQKYLFVVSLNKMSDLPLEVKNEILSFGDCRLNLNNTSL